MLFFSTSEIHSSNFLLSLPNNIDLNDINKKGFSTKGKNRGYGLHIVNKLVKSSDDIFFKQSISNSKFLSELKITLH